MNISPNIPKSNSHWDLDEILKIFSADHFEISREIEILGESNEAIKKWFEILVNSQREKIRVDGKVRIIGIVEWKILIKFSWDSPFGFILRSLGIRH
jgi:hypothetical protein